MIFGLKHLVEWENNMTFQPYQSAAEEEKRQAGLPLKIAKKGAILAGSIAGGGQLLRLLPFLNNLIPEKIARKGMEKILPDTGKFFNKAEKAGHPFEQAREFLREKLAPLANEEEENQSPSSPELQKERQRILALNEFNKRKKKKPSEFSREALLSQFEQGQQGQQGLENAGNGGGKENLVQVLQEGINLLRQMRGQ